MSGICGLVIGKYANGDEIGDNDYFCMSIILFAIGTKVLRIFISVVITLAAITKRE